MTAALTPRRHALERGEPTYISAQPCKHGHQEPGGGCKRVTSNGECVTCMHIRLQITGTMAAVEPPDIAETDLQAMLRRQMQADAKEWKRRTAHFDMDAA